MQNKDKNLPAFSLIEVLMSAFILGVGLTAVIGLLSTGLHQSIESRSQLVSAFLSQEGVELVRNIRDDNWAKGKPSLTGIDDGNNCRIDVTDVSLRCDGNYLLRRTGSGYYNHFSGDATKFSRKITVTGDSNQKLVTSYVVWGPDFPSSVSTCNTESKCAYTQIVLNKWKE